MKFPEFLKKNGTIGFVAPSFGCNIEPYKTSFNMRLKSFMIWVITRSLDQTVMKAAVSELVIHQRIAQRN